MCFFEIQHLQNNRSGFHDEYKSGKRNQEGSLRQNHRSRQSGAQRQRSGISHEDLRRMMVENQETDAPPGHGSAVDRTGFRCEPDAHRRKEQGYNSGDPGAQAVQSVGQIHAVGHGHHDEHNKRNVPDAEVHIPVQERNPHIRPQIRHMHDVQGQEHREQDLQQQFLIGPETQVMLLRHLDEIIQKSDQPEQCAGNDDDHHVHHVAAAEGTPCQTCHCDAAVQRNAAHCRRSLFRKVGLRPLFPDVLSELLLLQDRNLNPGEYSRCCHTDDQCDQNCDQICHFHTTVTPSVLTLLLCAVSCNIRTG